MQGFRGQSKPTLTGGVVCLRGGVGDVIGGPGGFPGGGPTFSDK